MTNLKEFCEEYINLKDIAVEIGSNSGLTSQTIAKYTSRLYCIDLWPDEAEFNEATSHYENIVKIRGMATDIAEVFADRAFDIIYLHDPQGIELWWPKLRQSGYLVGGNYMEVDRIVKKYFNSADEVLDNNTWIIRKQPGRMKWKDIQAACATSSNPLS